MKKGLKVALASLVWTWYCRSCGKENIFRKDDLPAVTRCYSCRVDHEVFSSSDNRAIDALEWERRNEE